MGSIESDRPQASRRRARLCDSARQRPIPSVSEEALVRLLHFSVTQVRVAATCPRLHCFDAIESQQRGRPVVTRLWRSSETGPAGGALFHHAIERFNRVAMTAPEVLTVLEGAQESEQTQRALLLYFNTHCLNLEALAERPVPMRVAFAAAVQGYMEELARIIVHARSGAYRAYRCSRSSIRRPAQTCGCDVSCLEESVRSI